MRRGQLRLADNYQEIRHDCKLLFNGIPKSIYKETKTVSVCPSVISGGQPL